MNATQGYISFALAQDVTNPMTIPLDRATKLVDSSWKYLTINETNPPVAPAIRVLTGTNA